MTSEDTVRASLPNKQLHPLIVEDIKQLIDHLSIEKVVLCGYSAGGSIVLEFLLSHPNRAWRGIIIGAVSIIPLSTALTQAKSIPLFRKLYHDAKRGNAKNATVLQKQLGI